MLLTMKNKPVYRALIILPLLIFSVVSVSFARESNKVGFNKAKSHWTILGGFGITHPGWGDTETRIEDVDLILQYGRFLSGEKGRSWYKTRHELLIEIPVYIVHKPESAVMTGINFLSCWNFTASEEIIPYIFTGGGFMYTSLDEPGLGTDYNGNYQAGVGTHYFIKENTTIDFNYRYHHISNADTAEPNEPLNSTKTFVGLSFFLD